jgi:SAM-dependent methyltransferase
MTNERDIYWGEFSEAALNALLALMRKGDYARAKAFVRDELDREDFIFGLARSDFMYYLPLTKESRVLDCGCGLGVHSFNLAPYVKEVVAFDQSKKRIEFCQLRKKFEHVENVHFRHASFDTFTLKPDHFDVVLMNGVLEWVGERNAHKNPRDDQKEVLTMARRALKPDGVLYVGIENRFSPAYLKGYDHNGLRFTNFLPRVLADLLTRWKIKKPYRTYTYSKSGYLKLFVDAGFPVEAIETYVAYPGYNNPQFVVPFDDLSSFRFLQRFLRKGAVASLLHALSRFDFLLRVLRHQFFAFLFLVRK